MKQITINEQVSEKLESKSDLSWNVLAGLSWIFLDDDFGKFHFTKKEEVETKH